MIEFIKDVNGFLPYDREKYILRENWYGISFQLPGVFEGEKVEIDEYLSIYEEWFKGVVLMLDNGSPWIINHDFIDEDWFPDNQRNLSSLRKLFKSNDIPNQFIGALILDKENLLKLTNDIITYPFTVLKKQNLLYDNLDISHSQYQLVIKISAHMCIDVLSTDLEFLRKIVFNCHSGSHFKVIEYVGTSLKK